MDKFQDLVIAILPYVTLSTAAFLVEALVEFFAGKIFENVPKLTPFKWLQVYIAGAVGVVGAFTLKLDIFQMLAASAGVNDPATTFGTVLTGMGIGRGSNFIHDLYDAIKAAIKLMLAKAQ